MKLPKSFQISKKFNFSTHYRSIDELHKVFESKLKKYFGIKKYISNVKFETKKIDFRTIGINKKGELTFVIYAGSNASSYFEKIATLIKVLNRDREWLQELTLHPQGFKRKQISKMIKKRINFMVFAERVYRINPEITEYVDNTLTRKYYVEIFEYKAIKDLVFLETVNDKVDLESYWI